MDFERGTFEKVTNRSTGQTIVSAATECEKGSLCGGLTAAAENTRAENLEDHEERAHPLCAERCLTLQARVECAA